MFQMINEEKASAEDQKIFWLKLALGVVAMACLVGLGYFFAYHR